MSLLKRKSEVIISAKERLSGLKTISQNIDFGAGLTVLIFEDLISKADKILLGYNNSIAATDSLRTDFEKIEAELDEMSHRLLKATNARFGPDSVEYEKAGGTMKSKRKHRRLNAKPEQ